MGARPAALAEASQVNISQGYHINGSVVEGSLVAADHSTDNTATPATTANTNDLVGVVVKPDESLLSVTGASGQTQVATSGVAYALVTDLNGAVKTGDHITASPLSGVGMRTTTTGRIIGIAQTDLASAVDIQTVSVKDKDGKTTSAKVGRILVVIDVGYYSGGADASRTVIPKVLQDVTNTIAGKPVSAVRVLLSGFLFLIALVISIILVYGAVRSSIVSIGRNPLSQPAVRKGLAQVLGFVVVILLVTLTAVYFILSR